MGHLVVVEVFSMLMVSASIGDDLSVSEVGLGSSAMRQDTSCID